MDNEIKDDIVDLNGGYRNYEELCWVKYTILVIQ